MLILILNAYSFKPSTHFCNSAAPVLPAKRFAGRHAVCSEQEGCKYLSVSPTPLPPLVANGITVLPEKSSLSKKVLIIVGATYHQIGKPTKTVSYYAKSFTLPLMAGREDLSLISTELREFLSCQFKSAAV